ncbi:MAG TPA: lmo0937 family membrane protein [Gemmatimonadales bacterium]|nr:lmo0937 family membrane protein [Gemmatimonadales bacterium]
MKGLIALGVVLLVAWVAGYLVFKTAGFLIHLLLIVGAIMLVVGLVKRASGRVSSRL